MRKILKITYINLRYPVKVLYVHFTVKMLNTYKQNKVIKPDIFLNNTLREKIATSSSTTESFKVMKL